MLPLLHSSCTEFQWVVSHIQSNMWALLQSIELGCCWWMISSSSLLHCYVNAQNYEWVCDIYMGLLHIQSNLRALLQSIELLKAIQHTYYRKSHLIAGQVRLRDIAHSHVCHDSFTCVTWLIHMCDMTQSLVWLDPLYVTGLVCMWNDRATLGDTAHILWDGYD